MAKLVTTGQAARDLGIHPSTLTRWAADGLVTPDFTTAGGHMRWDVDRVRREVKALIERERDTD